MTDTVNGGGGGYNEPILGEDVVLKERDPQTELLKELPLKAQLGFSSLKEKITNRGDKGLKQQILAAAKTSSEPLKVEYTCLDVTSQTIVIGSNLGIVFLYDRPRRKLSRFNCEHKQVPISSIKLLESKPFVATGQYNGAVTLFQYCEEKNGFMRVNLKCTVPSHHKGPVTAIQWTPEGTKLFTSDSEGNVAITVINMDEGKTHTVFICKEDSPVVQLSFCHTALLISTLKRTLIWPFNTKKTVQVGMQERKVFGNFGACFYPAAGPVATDEVVDVYVARPGLRLWKATIEGKVLTTMMFKDSINKGLPQIETLELAANLQVPPQQGEHKQFGPLVTFHDQFVTTWQKSCLWVMDPTTGVVVGCHSNLGCVVDVGVNKNELFVLTKGKEKFIRRVVFEVNPRVVVEELDLNNPSDVLKAQRTSSVSQFEDQDKLDKFIGEFGNKMNDALINVKSRVKGLKEQIRSREQSEDDRGSESDRFSSPKSGYKKKPTGGSPDGALTSEGYSTGEEKSEDCSKCTLSTDDYNYSDRPFESSNEFVNSCERSPEKVVEEKGAENNSRETTEETGGDGEPKIIEVTLTHKKREKEPVFSHLSKEEFPQDIVFEGTSIGTCKRKKKKKKTKKDQRIVPNADNILIMPQLIENGGHNTDDSDIGTLRNFNVNQMTDSTPGSNTFPRVEGNENTSSPISSLPSSVDTKGEASLTPVISTGETAFTNNASSSTTSETSIETKTSVTINRTLDTSSETVASPIIESGEAPLVSKATLKNIPNSQPDKERENCQCPINEEKPSKIDEKRPKTDEKLFEKLQSNGDVLNGECERPGILPDEIFINTSTCVNNTNTDTNLNTGKIDMHTDITMERLPCTNEQSITDKISCYKKNDRLHLHSEDNIIGDKDEMTSNDFTANRNKDTLKTLTDAELLFNKNIHEPHMAAPNQLNNTNGSNAKDISCPTHHSINLSTTNDSSETSGSSTPIALSPKTPPKRPPLPVVLQKQQKKEEQKHGQQQLKNQEQRRPESKDLNISVDSQNVHVEEKKLPLSPPTIDPFENTDTVCELKLNVPKEESAKISPSPHGISGLPNTLSSKELPVSSTSKQSTDNVVHVKFHKSHQRQGSNVSISSLSERCKEVKGEAVEHILNIDSPAGSTNDLLGCNDSIEANIQPTPNEPTVVSRQSPEDSEDEDGKLYPESSFPLPQLKSIYSDKQVSLSELSLSHEDLLSYCDDDDDFPDDEELLEEMMDYDRIDVQNDLIESIDSITDIEDNDGISEADRSLPQDILGTPAVRKKRRTKTRNSFPSSPSGSDLEGRPPSTGSKGVAPESIQERLRYLADSWADVNLPNCGQIQVIATSAHLVWVIDNADQIYYSPAVLSQVYTWKKLENSGKVSNISTNQNGSVVWCVDRGNTSYYRIGIRDGTPHGTKWEPFEKHVHQVAVDKDSVWVIKKNGDVFVRTGVSSQRPYGSTWITIKASSDLQQITCVDGIVWALDVYNHVQIFQGDLRTISVTDPSEHDFSWVELPGITATHINLGSEAVGWIIDRDSGIWFNQDVSRDNPSGGVWYQLSLGEGESNDRSWFSSVLSYFTNGNEPKMIVANEIAGVMILGRQGSVHVAHGHLLGTRWQITLPSQATESSCWTCVSAAGADMNKGYVWALQPNGQLYCFKSGRQSYNVQPPTRVVLKYCSAGPRSLWALTGGQDVYLRLGISDTCPQGLKWLKVDMMAQGRRRLTSICAGNHVVWAVDFEGNGWFQMGREDSRSSGYAPAWVSIDGCPLDGNRFTKIVVGPDDLVVWACDDKNNVYARKDIVENFWIGKSWELVSGTSGKDLAVSTNHVWSLCPNGDVLCRFGVSRSNVTGDYWRKVPGNFDKVSVGANDELWGIDRSGNLYQRDTLLFYGSTLSRKAPSYNDLFSDHNDWEFI